LHFGCRLRQPTDYKGVPNLPNNFTPKKTRMTLLPDFKELLEEFIRARVKVVLIGGYTVAFHGRPRSTKDIDFVFEHRPENLERAAPSVDLFSSAR